MKNAPCIRAIVSFSDILDEGMLFIATIKGGLIGREPRSDLVIPIPDINVSKVSEIKNTSPIYTEFQTCLNMCTFAVTQNNNLKKLF